MHLVVDIGNTSAHLALFKGSEYVRTARIATALLTKAAESQTELQQTIEGSLPEQKLWQQVTIGSVIPQLTATCERYFKTSGATVCVVTYQSPLTIYLAMDQPEAVGVDRIADAEAFWAKYHAAGIVIDFGSATTYNAMDGDGCFLGGAIAPGIVTANERLHRAAQLHPVPLQEPQFAIGRLTDDAIASGQYYAAVGAVERTLSAITSELREPDPLVVCTGGYGVQVAALLQIPHEYDPLLTVEGFRLIGERSMGP